MSLVSQEKGRTARNISALSAAGAMLSLMLGAANMMGARLDGEDIATQERYNAKRTAERIVYQQELEEQTPDNYTANGTKLVPQAVYQVSYPQKPLAPMRVSQEARQRNSTALFRLGGLAALVAVGAAYVARRQRQGFQLARMQSSWAVTQSEIAGSTVHAPQPALYGRPAHQTLAARREAQLSASGAAYNPFAGALNHEVSGLAVPEAPQTSPVAA